MCKVHYKTDITVHYRTLSCLYLINSAEILSGERTVTISRDMLPFSVFHHRVMRLLSNLFSKLSAFLHLPFSMWLIKYKIIREKHLH